MSIIPLVVTGALPTGGAIYSPIGNGSAGSVAFPTKSGGTTGTDYSANKPTLPNVGSNFSASGPYASYILIATVPASTSRSKVDIENTSGAQIVVIRDDGTAASGAAPTNASVFALAPGNGVGSQGGSWATTSFYGRLQIYAASSSAQIAVMVD